ncbi:MAG: hypothetical protein ACOCV2_04705 [Persicimonas sp.]
MSNSNDISNASNDSNDGESNDGQSNGGESNDSDETVSSFEATIEEDGEEFWSGSDETTQEELEEGDVDSLVGEGEDVLQFGLEADDGTFISFWVESSEDDPAPGSWEIKQQPETPFARVEYAGEVNSQPSDSTGREGTVELDTCPEEDGDLVEGRLKDVEVGRNVADGEPEQVRTLNAEFAVVAQMDESEYGEVACEE